MLSLLRSRASYANVVATIALVVAVAGGGQAFAGPIADTAASIGSSVKKALKLGKSADKRSKTALTTAKAAQAAAGTAQSTAQSAQSTAQAAQGTAQGAQGAAQGAQGAADQALAALAPPVFQNLTLQNDWTVDSNGDYGTPSFTKDAFGFVHLSGALDGSGTTDLFIATLPTGFRPTRATYLWHSVSVTDVSSAPVVGAILIDQSTGDIFLHSSGDIDDFVSLEGVSFYAG